jgi:hypothetical protein
MGEWNLDTSESYTQIRVFQISAIDYDESDIAAAIRTRTLVLSHLLAWRGFAAFFLDSSPSYAQNQHSHPIVLLFDISGVFDASLIPSWAGSDSWLWDPTQHFDAEISDHLLRALTLSAYYRHHDHRPMYFTSFLLFPGSGSVIDPFIYQRVPVLRGSSLFFRVICRSGLHLAIAPRRPPRPGTFLLIPPHEHPFLATSALADGLDCLSIDRSRAHFPSSTHFACLTRPPALLDTFFHPPPERVPPPPPAELRPLCCFSDVELFPYTTQFVKVYVLDPAAAEVASPPDDGRESAVLEDGAPSPEQVVGVEAPREARRAIAACLGARCAPPSLRAALAVPAASGAFFGRGAGSGSGSPAPSSARLGAWSPVEYDRAGVPAVVVARQGAVTEFPADALFPAWPGPKNAHFVALFEPGLASDDVAAFTAELAHSYNQFGLGRLLPIHRRPTRFSTFCVWSVWLASQYDGGLESDKASQCRDNGIAVIGKPDKQERYPAKGVDRLLKVKIIARRENRRKKQGTRWNSFRVNLNISK